MKACSYCGRQTADEQRYCAGCGTEFETEARTPVREERVETGTAQPLDFSLIEMGYSFVEGYSRPDWDCVYQSIRKSFSRGQLPEVWRKVGVNWLTQLKKDLGGDYRTYESPRFLLLSAETVENSSAMVHWAENELQAIETSLDFLAQARRVCWKRVILAFNEQDDYYSYISYFVPDGHHSISAGVFLDHGYGHIALPFTTIQQVKQVITHELTHHCLMGLHLPTWLNEGLSRRMESTVKAQRFILTRELAGAQHAYWNERNIQGFWAGTSFYGPDEGNELSYNLGEIMVEQLSGNWGDFLNFVQNADPQDGGQDAALKCLDQCLGDALAGFLGPGQWRPSRKIIAELWEQRRRED